MEGTNAYLGNQSAGEPGQVSQGSWGWGSPVCGKLKWEDTEAERAPCRKAAAARSGPLMQLRAPERPDLGRRQSCGLRNEAMRSH